MADQDAADIDALTHVARIFHDQLKVYPLAVSISDDDKATAIIERTISQRWGMLEQVEPAIRNRGGEPPQHGTPTGLYHQAATAIHGAIDKNARTAIYEVCKGEDDLLQTVHKYAEDEELSEATRAIMSAFVQQLTPTHAEIASLKQALEG